MNLYFRSVLMLSTVLFLLMLTLLPTWFSPVFTSPTSQPSHRLAYAAPPIKAMRVMTFTPVITLYLPFMIQNSESVAPAPQPTGQPTVEPTPEPTLEPTPEPGGPNVKITQIVYDPDGVPDIEGEYVELKNFGPATVNLTDWTLRDEADTLFTFPVFSLASQATVRLWVKDGLDTPTTLFWGRGSAVWNNGGDAATLRDAAAVEVDSCTYPGGAPGFFECN